VTDISAHSDHRPQDIRFPRTMSREMAALPWEHRRPAFKTWSNHIYACVGAILLGLLALGWG